MRTAARARRDELQAGAVDAAARVLPAHRLDAEEKKFAAGMSTNFFVTQAQRDLALAEVTELAGIADYRKSLIELERVQEAGIGASVEHDPGLRAGSSRASRRREACSSFF